jgi:hypothetical protein
MNKLIEIIKQGRIMLIPIVAAIILAGLYPSYCTPKNRPQTIGDEFTDLSTEITKHTQSINAKLGDEYSAGTISINPRPSDPAELPALAASSIESIFAPSQIRGIAFLKDNPLVFIGSRVFKPGDQLRGFTIESIETTGFTISDPDGKQTKIWLNVDTQTNQ